jgi:demethylmenaquinone methyltransferase/2-methoxy-6-polyprenyl-1,4-benzoquinol methylase
MQGPSPEKVQEIFKSVAGGYDQANRLMTLGLDIRWRMELVRWSEAHSGDSVLDCATGTGDLALAFKKRLGARSHVVGTDFSREMLSHAPVKAKKEKLDVTFEWADAMELPYPDASFDVVSIAYGIRNVEDPIKAVGEMIRVLKPGGRLMILETGTTRVPLLGFFLKMHFKFVVPFIGGMITGDKKAYQYLQKSSSAFPGGEDFAKILREVPEVFEVRFKSFIGGASYLYRVFKTAH